MRSFRSLFVAVSCVFAFAEGVACSDDAAAPAMLHDGGNEAGAVDGSKVGVDGGGHGGHDRDVVDSGPSPIRCTPEELAALDLTDGGALTVTFLKNANPKQYENRCATVKVGATVTFTGSFRQHPLEAAGGDSPNPIPYVAQDQPDDEVEVTFPNAGTFGYRCEFHPTLMFGAIRVVP